MPLVIEMLNFSNRIHRLEAHKVRKAKVVILSFLLLPLYRSLQFVRWLILKQLTSWQYTAVLIRMSAILEGSFIV